MVQFLLSSACLALALALAGCQSSRLPSPSLDNTATSSQNTSTAVLWVHGMACPQCAYNVDLQLLKVPGVENVTVDMGSGRVVAQLSSSNAPTREQLAAAVAQTGFTLKRIDMPQAQVSP